MIKEEQEEEGVTGLYTPHSWKLMGLFTTQRRAREKMQLSEREAPSLPSLRLEEQLQTPDLFKVTLPVFFFSCVF